MGSRAIFAIATAWLVASVAGLGALMAYKAVPGEAGSVPARWPEGTRLERAASGPTLVFAAHPRCACTRASITELARLVSSVGAKVKLHILFVRPEGVADEWMRTDTWESASLIPGATVTEDPGGAEARRFGAETSGQVVVYDAEGRLAFRGGITGSRGHEGENAGLAGAIASVRAAAAPAEGALASAVFGCALAEAKVERDVEEGERETP